MRRITLIQGHPDRSAAHFCHALADAYAAGAAVAGHTLVTIDVASLSFPLIRSQSEFEHGDRPADILAAQNAIRDSDHLLLVYPLWLGTMPALLKGFFEQVFRYDFAFQPMAGGRFERKLRGRSARVIVTMGMPAWAYRWYFGGHGLKNLERNILAFSGIRPVRETLLGRVEQVPARRRERWLAQARAYGTAGR